MKKENIIFLEHIVSSIEKIESFSKGLSKEKFIVDELRQSALIRQIEIIGEAVKNLPIDFINKYPMSNFRDLALYRLGTIFYNKKNRSN